MGYLGIVICVFFALGCVFGLMLIHYVIFTLAGLFKKKTFPPAEEKLKYGIIISARNEEAVIADLINSIHATDYPRDKLQIFLVAHNCDDKTAEIARNLGATVYEYNNPAERTVGYAYKYLADRINEDWGSENYDGFFVINADNTVTENYFTKMNDAFVANGRKHVITSYRNSKNFGSNYMSCLYGVYFISACRLESRGRTALGCSTRVSGTGYLFNSEFLKDGWEYVTLTEDWEFTADRVARGTKIIYCDDAEFFDEQPTTLPIMWRQRLRWARGHMIVFFTRFKALIKALFTPKSKGGPQSKFSVYDAAASIMPLGVISVLLMTAQLICISLCPLFGYDAGKVWAWYGIFSAAGFVLSYLITFLTGVLLFILERKRIPKAGGGTMFAALLLWPFFLLLNVILDVIALFKRNLEWKTIPHGDKEKNK